MAEYDERTNTAYGLTLQPDNYASTDSGNGSSADLQDAEAATFVFHAGTLTSGADVSFTIQESDDDSNWSDVDSSDLIGSAPNFTSADNAAGDVESVGYVGTKRYVRVQYDATSGSADADLAVGLHKGRLRRDGTSIV